MNLQSTLYMISRIVAPFKFKSILLLKLSVFKLTIIMSVFFLFTPRFSCYALDKEEIEITSVRIYRGELAKIPSGLERFEIEIDIKNISNHVLFFWSMYRGWQRNYIINNSCLDFYVHCIGDAPKCDLLFPGVVRKYKGVLYRDKFSVQPYFENFTIGFKYYNALKINERTYVSDFFYQHSDRLGQKNIPHFDIIWYRKPVQFECQPVQFESQFEHWIIN